MVHGRASNLVGGIERYEDNTYVDLSVRERELELAQKDQLFGEISGLPQMMPPFGMEDEEEFFPTPPPPKPKKKKDKKKFGKSRRRNCLLGALIDWWYAEPEEPDEEELEKQRREKARQEKLDAADA